MTQRAIIFMFPGRMGLLK